MTNAAAARLRKALLAATPGETTLAVTTLRTTTDLGTLEVELARQDGMGRVTVLTKDGRQMQLLPRELAA